MADPIIPSAPRQFSFGGRLFYGRVTGFSGTNEWRSVSHVSPKRDGGVEEDMGRVQFSLDVQLVFIGQTCARDYQDAVAFFDANRTALLVHPFAGKWTAFIKTASYRVKYAEATNLIEAPLHFVESELDGTTAVDVPDVATAAQNATGQQTQFQQTVAAFMAGMAKLQTQSVQALNSLDNVLGQLSAITAPVDFAQAEINLALGAASSIVGTLSSIAGASDDLSDAVTGFIASATDIFNGISDTIPSGSTDSVANLLATVIAKAETLETALMAAPTTPAGAADAVGDVHVMVDACMTLSDAVAAAQPPTTVITVGATINLLVLAQNLIADFGLSYDALTYGSLIMGYNRIANPAAIPSGTLLVVPTA